jgi:hypothetical protein
VNREYEILDYSAKYGSHLNRYICVDIKITKEVFEIFKDHQDKILQIQERILTVPNMYYDHYKKEGFDEVTKNITAITLCDKQNTRFYCQEKSLPNGEFLIICGAVFSKKSQKNNKSNKPLIQTIASYNYEKRIRER